MDETPTPQGSQTLSIWSLILGVVALALALVFFISIPAAIAAIVLGIIVLTKHHPGKGKAMIGVITGGVAFLAIPILIAFTVIAFNAVNDRAHETQQASLQRSVDSPCFTYTVPAGYTYNNASNNCTTSVNIPGGDTLTQISVKGNTGTIGSLKDVVASFDATLKANNPNTPGVIDQEQFISNGNTVYYVSYNDGNGLLFGNYIIPDSNASHKDETGKTITAYSVAGYTYNSGLKSLVRGIVDSLKIT